MRSFILFDAISGLRENYTIMATKSDTKASEPKPKKSDEGVVHGHITVKGNEGGGRRLFQITPEVKEWLTEDQAKAQGFYWRDEKKEGPA